MIDPYLTVDFLGRAVVGAVFRVSVHTGRIPERCPECRAERKRQQAAKSARARRAKERGGPRA